MRKVIFTLDEPATALLQSALNDADGKTIEELVRGFGPLDFIGDFDVVIPSGAKVAIGTMNEFYRVYIKKFKRNDPLPEWNWDGDKIWRGQEVREDEKRIIVNG